MLAGGGDQDHVGHMLRDKVLDAGQVLALQPRKGTLQAAVEAKENSKRT